MSDVNEAVQPSAGTRFPFINLEKALARAKQLFDADERGRDMPLGAAFGVWEYSEKSSGGFQTIAALKMYGLAKDANGGDIRKVALSDLALRYFRDEREEEKTKIVREFALKPKLVAALWAEWGVSPPADPVARSHLKAERGLTDQGARSLLAIYKENIVFAGLMSEPKSEETALETPTAVVGQQGDFLGDVARSFLGVGQSRERPMQQSSSVLGSSSAPLQPALSEGMRREVITLDEGEVVISFPENMTAASFGDLKDHLELFIKKMERRAKPKDERPN